MAQYVLGGYYGVGWRFKGHESGSGGAGGAGGDITVSENAKVYAYNGNLYTDGTNNVQCPIYCQNGTKPLSYETTFNYPDATKPSWTVSLTTSESLIKTSKIAGKKVEYIYVEKSGYVNPLNEGVILNINEELGITTNDLLRNVEMKYQGVGSGAGFVENDNGTYRVK